jgi:hypothetical protein
MPLVKIHEAGKIGLISDVADHELPPEAWTTARNVVFRDGKVKKARGQTTVFGTPSIAPYGLFPVYVDGVAYWVYAGTAKVYVVQGGTHTNITRQSAGVDVDYSMTTSIPWTGGVLNGVLVLNNGVDDPQMWLPAGPSNKLQALSNWPANTKCQFLRPFRNYLIAGDVTKSGVRDPYLIKWSHPADPATVPDSWDHTDPAKDAGEYPLAETPGLLIDCLPMGDVNAVYKSDCVYGMQHTGGDFVFRFWRAPFGAGMLNKRCAAMMPDGSGHFVVTNDDVIGHNLHQAKSLITNRIRRSLFNRINTTATSACFVLPNYKEDSILFCFPENGETLCTLALVWNYRDDTFQYRELPYLFHANTGEADETVDLTWDADSEVWDQDSSVWDAGSFGTAVFDAVIASPQNTKLYLLNDTNQFDGANMHSHVERTGLPIAGVDRFGQPKVDTESIKLWRRVWLRGEGGPVQVMVGTQMVIGGPIEWSEEKTFTFGTDKFLDFLRPGRALAIHIHSEADVDWELHGYDVDIEVLGAY